jgi:pyruvate kinase
MAKKKEEIKNNEEWKVQRCTCPDVSIVPIIATIGPSVYDPENKKDILKELICAGAGAFRINFSHVSENGDIIDDKGNKKIKKYSYKNVNGIIERIRKIEEDTEIPIPVIMDLKGPEIRVLKISKKGKEGKLEKEEEIEVKEEENIHLWQENEKQELPSTSNINKLIEITFEGKFSREIKTESIIRIDDGRIELEVKEIKKGLVTTEVKTGGKIEKGKSINLPGIKLRSVESITEKDKNDLKQCFDVDIIAQSFVRNFRDVGHLNNLLSDYYSNKSQIPKIIAKIENEEAVHKGRDKRGREVDNFLDILEEESTFSIMIGRGDLGGELGIEKVPKIQERLIDYANRVGKPIIVATQMLESMRKNPVPTRAEAEDIYSAIKQGADTVMLSGETANGDYPIEAVKRMGMIIDQTEIDHESYRRKFCDDFVYGGIYKKGTLPEYAVDVVGYPLVTMANGAKSPFIITFATKAWSATRISRFRPNDPTHILALTVKPQIARVLRFLYKVCPVLLTKNNKYPDDLPREREKVIKLFKDVIDQLTSLWKERQGSDSVVTKQLGEDWKDRFIVATLAHQKPERWDVVRALMVFKL